MRVLYDYRLNSSMVDDILDALKVEMVSQDANITGSIDIVRDVTQPNQ